MKRSAMLFSLFLGALISTPASLLAESCGPQSFGKVKLHIEDDKLLTDVGSKTHARYRLPVVGSGWRCLKMRAFPKRRLLFVEWHQGEAGTSQIFHRTSLLAFSVNATGVQPRGNWTLSQGYRGKGPDIIEATQTYRLEETDWSIDVVLTGARRVHIEIN